MHNLQKSILHALEMHIYCLEFICNLTYLATFSSYPRFCKQEKKSVFLSQQLNVWWNFANFQTDVLTLESMRLIWQKFDATQIRRWCPSKSINRRFMLKRNIFWNLKHSSVNVCRLRFSGSRQAVCYCLRNLPCPINTSISPFQLDTGP